MNTIIIICNDPRIAIVKKSVQPLIPGKITIIPDYEAGLSAIFEKRPEAVFIQHEINGVKAVTVTGTVRALLQGHAPRLILLGPSIGNDTDLMGCDSGINLSLPDELLCGEWVQLLKTIPTIRWKNNSLISSEPGAALPEPGAMQGQDDLGMGEQEPVSQIPPLEIRLAGVPLPPPPAHGSLPTRQEKQSAPMTKPILHEQQESSEKTEATAGRAATALEETGPGSRRGSPATSATGANPRPEYPPAQSGRRTRLPRTIMTGAVLALLIGVGAFLALRPGTPEQATGTFRNLDLTGPLPVAQPVSAASLSDRSGLPSFISRDDRDMAYGATKPGWERYVSPRREYLVCRENGMIKALQIIALQQGAIDDAFVATALHELGGGVPCVSVSVSAKDSYVVEKKTMATKGEILIYRKKETGHVRGVVFTFS